jgi:integrase
MKQHPGALPANIASLTELPPGTRPKALVWTDERARAWQKNFDAALAAARETGGRVSPVDIWISMPRPSVVMVWTPAQTMVFLEAARRHRLHALWRLIATRGLRRGESCGLRRPDTDLRAALSTIRWQITQLGWDPVQGVPKSDAGERTVALDADTVTDIATWRREQDQDKQAAGAAWAESGFEFTDELGNPLHPATVTDAFHLLAYLAGLPPIRLHDLRHGAATLLLAAGHDMKVVQETLGLSSITIAADTYTSVLPQLARQSAEDVAALIRPDGHTLAVPGRRRQAARAARKPRETTNSTSRPAGRRPR